MLELISRITKNSWLGCQNHTPPSQVALDAPYVIVYVASMKCLAMELFGVVATIVWLFSATVAGADGVTLIPSEDATISEKSLDLSLGSATTLDSGTTGPNEGLKMNRALLKFDLKGIIPSNALVASAALTLTVVQAPTTTNLWFSLHKVLQDWSEGAVTWTNRLSPPAPWSTPGGSPPQDYSSSVSQSNLITGLEAFTFASNPDMVGDVQDWVSYPANNFGWILICELEALEKSVRKFASREYTFNSVPTNQPKLEVQFTLPLTLTLLPRTNGQFQFLFNAESNRNYTAEYGSDLLTTNWMVLTNITPLSAPGSVLVSDAILADGNRFYRVRTP